MDEFKDSSSALIADVDCTAAGKDLCDKNGVKGYPTIKYGDPSDLKEYSGGRKFDDLKKFAEENLGPTCGPDNLDLCDEERRAKIENVLKMDSKELETAIAEADAKVQKIEAKNKRIVDDFKEQIKVVQGKIEGEKNKKKAELEKLESKLNLAIMKQVATAKRKAEEDDGAKKKKKKKGKKSKKEL